MSPANPTDLTSAEAAGTTPTPLKPRTGMRALVIEDETALAGLLVSYVTFARPDLTTFARLDESCLEVVRTVSSQIVRSWPAVSWSPTSGALVPALRRNRPGRVARRCR